MSSGIFLVGEDGELVEMREQPYDSEAVLQELLARYPNLLAGDQVPGVDRRAWVLVKREAGVAADEGGGNRWWIDHVFVDQDGVPTLVEVKRSTDSRIRREVVGQMLDYAANALAYWPPERLQQAFEDTCAARGVTTEEALAALLGSEADEDHFWTLVRTNLEAGRLRLVFVADLIPPELERVVEFLNRSMRQVDVVALEIKRFAGGAQTNLVARLLGQSAATRQVKSLAREKQSWDEAQFFAALANACEPADVETMREVFDWSRSHFTRMKWGGGARGSVTLTLDIAGESYPAYALWTSGTVQFWFTFLARRAPFDEPAIRQEFRRRLNEVEGAAIDSRALEGMPSISIRVLRDAHNRRRFEDAIEWFLRTARGA